MEVGLAELRGRQEKGEVFGGRGGWPSGTSLSPEGPYDSSSPPPHAGLVHLVVIILLEGGGE